MELPIELCLPFEGHRSTRSSSEFAVGRAFGDSRHLNANPHCWLSERGEQGLLLCKP